MLKSGRITAEHIKKLDHHLDEIRLRALDNIILKYNFGFVCDCNVIKKGIILKLFNWFSFESVPQPEKVLDFLLWLVQADANGYVNAFGKLKFQNELQELKRKISLKWHAKVDEIKKATLHVGSEINRSDIDSKKNLVINMNSESNQCATQVQSHIEHRSENNEKKDEDKLSKNDSLSSSLYDGGIRWLAMPWQPLVTSDKAVLAAVEEALNTTDTNLILHTCQFIMNVMMQDFPAEVFLQRPAIVMILHDLLESSANVTDSNIVCVIPIVLKTLRKLTRALRFRIYYYCEPCIANKEQKLLADKLDSNAYASSEAEDGPDGGITEVNYQLVETSETRSQNINKNIDDSALQTQQMLLPDYCIDSLKYILSHLNIPADSPLPLQNVKYIVDLAHELVRLLIISITPYIWFDNHMHTLDDLNTLFNLLGKTLKHFCSLSNEDYLRITYLHLITITMRLLGGLVPLDLASYVIPDILQECLMQIEMDGPINLLYPELHSMICSYVRKFENNNSIIELVHQEIPFITDCIKNISILENLLETLPRTETNTVLKVLTIIFDIIPYINISIVKIILKFLRDNWKHFTNDLVDTMVTNLMLKLFYHEDINILRVIYIECHIIVKSILVEDNKDNLSWENLLFLLKPQILTIIICNGITSKDSKISDISKDILTFILNGRVQMGEIGWSIIIKKVIIPILYLLQCYADSQTTLGQSINKLFDPDIANSISLPSIELLKGNIRSLYSPHSDIRKEASCRLIWFLSNEENSAHKLPSSSSLLHDSSLSSLCILERKSIIKNIDNNSIQTENVKKLLEMLKKEDIVPNVRKFILNQINIILADVSKHECFLKFGVSLILEIFDKALTEDNYMYYSDSVIPVIGILKSISFFNYSIRKEFSDNSKLLLNILRSLLLFPNKKRMKSDGVQLLCLLVYGEHVHKQCLENVENDPNLVLSDIVLTNMKIPFECHSLINPYKIFIKKLHIFDNHLNSSFLRLNIAWEFHGRNILSKCINDLKIPAIFSEVFYEIFMVTEKDLLFLQYNSIQYCCQKQLYNIQNSTTHNNVLRALDFLTMYLKFYEVLPHVDREDIDSLPWEQTFERFLLSRPTNKDDCDLFVNILNFLHLYLTVRKNGECSWISKIVKNMTRSLHLADLFKNLEINNPNAHQFIFKLVRTCSTIEGKSNNEFKNTWIQFIEFVVSTLCFEDQQHYYNLAYLDWLLTCLTYLISQCEWGNYKNLLISLCNTLIELIISFHGAGTVSFMGLSITRNSIICLNHLLHEMQVNFNKNSWAVFWYEEGRSLSWLPTLWQNRDPLVRASALQLLAGLMNIVHTMSQLLNAIVMAPSDLCHTLLNYITNKDECCLVKEEACIVFSNMLKNCNATSIHCDDSLQPQAILIYAEQHNIYHEISELCSNIFNLTTVDIKDPKRQGNSGKTYKTLGNVQEIVHPFFCKEDQFFVLPYIIWHLYYCQDEMHPLFSRNNFSDLVIHNYITTPTFITAICTLLNNLIFVGEHEVVRQIYEHSIDKYLFWCLDKIPEIVKNKKDLNDYSDKLEMYINICTVLTNSIRHSKEYTTIVLFSRESLYILFRFLNIDLYQFTEPHLIYLRNRLWTEIYNFIAALSLMENQHFETIRKALKLCEPQKILASICFAIKDSAVDLKMSAISCLAVLLSLEIQNNSQEEEDFLRTILDTTMMHVKTFTEDSSEKIRLDMMAYCNVWNKNKEDDCITNNKPLNQNQTIGGELCEFLLHLFTTYNYAKFKKNSKQAEDKDLVIGALTNLLCVSLEAKRTALQNNFPETALMILKELYVKLNTQPLELYKKQTEKKTTSLLHDVTCIFMLLTNFMYKDIRIKENLTKKGLADVIHKLWARISINKTVLISALKLLATFTTNSNIAAQSLTLTTIIPGSGLRKTPNTLALIHAIIQVICKEIERTDHLFDNDKIYYAFHVLRNAVHVHECRVSISKSNLLQLFTKIHPIVNKKTKSWQLMEMYYLEFLIDFTYYEEGQLCVPKATEALDVLIHLAKESSSSNKILAISVLRNLAFNTTNRSRLLYSMDFINFLHDIFKNDSLNEINLAGSILWSLISNNQKGKLIVRSAGFSRSIQEAIKKLNCNETEFDIVKVLFYVLSMFDPDIKKVC